jgi:hypothetical protein
MSGCAIVSGIKGKGGRGAGGAGNAGRKIAYMEEGVHCLSGRALDVNDIRDDDVAVSLEPSDLLLYHRVLHRHIN